MAAPAGARQLVLAQLLRAATLVVGLAVLSRILTPAEFGYVAVPVAIVGVGEILRDLGLSSAAITQPHLQPHQRDILFWVNVATGLALALCVSALAPLMAAWFSNERMNLILPALSTVFLLNGVSAQYRADLTRRLRFAALSIVDSAAPLLGVSAAIVAALLGAGYWALVIQSVATAAAALGFVVALGRWRPGRPRQWRESKQILAFGASVSWSQVLGYLGNNVDTFALGIWASPTQLGTYTRAFQLAVQPLSLLKAPATSVALPLLSQRRTSPSAFKTGTVISQIIIGYSVVPAAVLLAACAEPAVFVLLGTQWSAAVPLVSVLAIAGALQQAASVSNWMLVSANLGATLRRYSLLSFATKSALVLAVAHLGAMWVAMAFLTSIAVTAPILMWWACRACDIPVRAIVGGATRPLLAAAVAGAAAYAAVHAGESLPAVIQILLGTSAFAAVYGVLCVFRVFRSDVRVVTTMLFGRH